jgi:hypothetical protein
MMEVIIISDELNLLLARVQQATSTTVFTWIVPFNLQLKD